MLRRRGPNRPESGRAFGSASSQSSVTTAAGLTPQAQRLRESLAGFFDQVRRWPDLNLPVLEFTLQGS
jgi:hypothetical protein